MITPDRIKAVYEEELAQWEATQAVLEARYRVFKRLNEKDQMEAITKDLVRCETAIAAWKDEIGALDKEPTA